jgi:type IV pilus assembly protein PilM
LTDLFESAPLAMDELDAADRPVVITEAIIRLFQENNLKPGTVVTAIPGHLVSTRVLKLPLPESQVAKVLPFELESHIPFDLDEILVDYHLIRGDKSSSIVLAAAAKKTTVGEHLALTKGAQIEPAFIGLDSLYLSNLNQQILKNDAGTYAIVDIGHTKTSVCIIHDHQVQYVRTLFTAGITVTESIRTDLDLTLPQALQAKHDHGILELPGRPLKSPDLKRLSDAIQKTIDPVLRELIQTLQAYRAQYASILDNPPSVERIYLTGGTTLIRNLPEYIKAATGLEAERLNLFASRTDDSTRAGADREPVFAQSVGLGLRAAIRGAAARKVSGINFRQSEFSFARDMSDVKKKAAFFGKWALAIFMAALLHVVFKYENYARQGSEINKVCFQDFKRIVPDEKKPPKDCAAALKILRDRIGKYRAKQDVLTAGLNEMTALGVLREISARIPDDIPLDTQELSIDRNKATLRANTDSFASVDRVISVLREFQNFQKIDKGDIRDSADGKKVFSLTITISGKEKEAQAKGKKTK